MSRIRANSITNAEGTGAPLFPNGLSVTGVITATSFGGNVTGNATGLSGTPNITVNNITSSNINSSGIITATSSVVGSGITINNGGIRVTGIVTATSFVGSGANLTNLNIPAGFDWRDASLF